MLPVVISTTLLLVHLKAAPLNYTSSTEDVDLFINATLNFAIVENTTTESEPNNSVNSDVALLDGGNGTPNSKKQPGANGKCIPSEPSPDNIGQPSREIKHNIDNGDSSENDLTETPRPSESSEITFKSPPDEGAEGNNSSESYLVTTLPPLNNIGDDTTEIVSNKPIISTEEERNTTTGPPTNVGSINNTMISDVISTDISRSLGNETTLDGDNIGISFIDPYEDLEGFKNPENMPSTEPLPKNNGSGTSFNNDVNGGAESNFTELLPYRTDNANSEICNNETKSNAENHVLENQPSVGDVNNTDHLPNANGGDNLKNKENRTTLSGVGNGIPVNSPANVLPGNNESITGSKTTSDVNIDGCSLNTSTGSPSIGNARNEMFKCTENIGRTNNMTTTGPSAELSCGVIEDMSNETVSNISSDQSPKIPSTKPSSFTGKGKNTVSSPDIDMAGTNKAVSGLDNNIDSTTRVITSALLKVSPINFVEGNNGDSTKNESNPGNPEKLSSDSPPNENNCKNFDGSAETNLLPGVYGSISENINNTMFSNDEISDSFRSTTTKPPTAVSKDDTSGRNIINNLQSGVGDNSPPPMNMNNINTNCGMEINRSTTTNPSSGFLTATIGDVITVSDSGGVDNSVNSTAQPPINESILNESISDLKDEKNYGTTVIPEFRFPSNPADSSENNDHILVTDRDANISFGDPSTGSLQDSSGNKFSATSIPITQPLVINSGEEKSGKAGPDDNSDSSVNKSSMDNDDADNKHPNFIDNGINNLTSRSDNNDSFDDKNNRDEHNHSREDDNISDHKFDHFVMDSKDEAWTSGKNKGLVGISLVES